MTVVRLVSAGWGLPAPPEGLVYPQTAQLVATVLAGSVMALAILYALWGLAGLWVP